MEGRERRSEERTEMLDYRSVPPLLNPGRQETYARMRPCSLTALVSTAAGCGADWERSGALPSPAKWKPLIAPEGRQRVNE